MAGEYWDVMILNFVYRIFWSNKSNRIDRMNRINWIITIVLLYLIIVSIHAHHITKIRIHVRNRMVGTGCTFCRTTIWFTHVSTFSLILIESILYTAPPIRSVCLFANRISSTVLYVRLESICVWLICYILRITFSLASRDSLPIAIL